jgi:Co/Zn/Cd efflux system component
VTALLVVGLTAHSLAVFAAGADYLADAAAIGVSLLAIWLAARPRGYPNATNIAALVNAGWLLILNIAITLAAIWHLAAGAHRVEGLPVLAVSAIAAAVMLAGALVLGGDTDDAAFSALPRTAFSCSRLPMASGGKGGGGGAKSAAAASATASIALARAFASSEGMVTMTGAGEAASGSRPRMRHKRPRFPSAMRPWIPQYGGLQRYKVTHGGTAKKRPASAHMRS